MKYARSDVVSITVGDHRHGLDDRADPDHKNLSVDCVECEPALETDPLWAASYAEVPLTVQEQKEADARATAADDMTARMFEAFAAQARQAVAAEADDAEPATPPVKRPPAKKAPARRAASK